MAENNPKINPIAYLVGVGVIWFALMKGNELYVNYKMIKDVDDKIAFMKANNAGWPDMCVQYSYAISMATQVQNQEKFDEYKNAAVALDCDLFM